MKINIIIGVLIALSIFATQQSFNPTQPAASPAMASPAMAVPSLPAVSPVQLAKKSASIPAQHFRNRQSVAKLPADESASSEPSIDSISEQIWFEEEMPVDLPEHQINRGLTSSKPVKINREQFKKLQVGDQVELNIPQLTTRYAASIDDIVEHSNGDLSWRGHLTDFEDPYAVIVTMGKSSYFATIATPEGAFLLEAADNSGWMLALADLEGLIDTNLQDYQIPDIQR